MASRRLTSEPLQVDPALIGAVLASPARRLLAFLLDGVVLVVPTIAVAVGAAALSIPHSDPRGFHALRAVLTEDQLPPSDRIAIRRDLVPLLIRYEARGMPAAAIAAAEEGDLAKAATLIGDDDIGFALNMSEGSEAATPRHGILFPVQNAIPPYLRVVALLGVPGLYFTLLTASRRGATFGKRLLGLRVARLDGERLSLVESLERFVGYVHLPGTMFVSVADLWRDPNRRLPHDRVVHTAVIRYDRRALVARRHAGAAHPTASSSS